MVEINEKELEEKEDTLPTEADEAQEANKSVTEQLADFKEEKEKSIEERTTTPKTEPIESKTTETKPKGDPAKREAFIKKLTDHFGLESTPDQHGCCQLRMKEKGFLIIKVLPRHNCWYGVYREVPENDNKWKAFRIKTQEEEDIVYNHVKTFIKFNSTKSNDSDEN